MLKHANKNKAARIFGGRKKEKSVTIPDQSMSIREIMERYVRGLPADVIHRDPVYVDQEEYDLEKVSRMDFAEKTEFADHLRAQNEATSYAINEELARRRDEAKQSESDKRRPKSAPSGSDDLDNTLPDDTAPDSQPDSRSGKKAKK